MRGVLALVLVAGGIYLVYVAYTGNNPLAGASSSGGASAGGMSAPARPSDTAASVSAGGNRGGIQG